MLEHQLAQLALRVVRLREEAPYGARVGRQVSEPMRCYLKARADTAFIRTARRWVTSVGQ